MDGRNRVLIRPLLRMWIALVLLHSPVHAWAQADYAREQRWADEIVPAIVVGDALRLELKSGRKVLAIYTPAPKAMAGVVVVHGLGVNPDWGLIGTLRSRLPDYGYATLSVQMPVLAAGALGEALSGALPGSGRAAGRRRGASQRQGIREGGDRVPQHGRAHEQLLSHARPRRPGRGMGGDRRCPLLSWSPPPSGSRCSTCTAKRTARPCSATRPRAPPCSAPSAVRRRSRSPGPIIIFAGREDELTRQVRLFLDRRLR